MGVNHDERGFLARSMKGVLHADCVIEIGSWVGVSAAAICSGLEKYKRKAKLYAIDPFDDEYYKSVPALWKCAKNGSIRGAFISNMRHYVNQYVLMQTTSENAVSFFDNGSCGFIFIDGDHSYEAVKKDISLWLPKMRKGAIMCGHDYGMAGTSGVTQAVNEIFKTIFRPARTIWATYVS